MSAPTVSRQAIVSQILSLKSRERDKPGRRVVAIRALPEWAEEAEFEEEGEHISVVTGTSPLAVRAALAERDVLDVWLVILTELSESELGAEVLARLARRRLEFIDPWDAAARAFGLTEVDPLLREKPQLADLLLRYRPTSGYPRVPSMMLMREHALDAICTYGLRLPALASRGGPLLLEWLATAGSGLLWNELPTQAQDELAGWWASVAGIAGELAPSLLARGVERDAIAFGLAGDAIAASGDKTAAGFLAARIGSGGVVDQLAAYGEAARQASDPSGYSTQRAEALLDEAKATDLAVCSDVLPAGLEQRLTATGDALREALADADAIPSVQLALDRCARHRDATAASARISAAQSALRLVRFLHTPTGAAPASLEEAAYHYRATGAWVDRARTTMQRGESNPSLIQAFELIGSAVTERREGENRGFAELTANWIGAGGSVVGVIPVEDVLGRVVAPLASAGVLVIVLDGASIAIWTELAEGLSSTGWAEVAQDAQAHSLCGFATVPSVTKFSRASLLAGTLTDGTAKDEAKAFAAAFASVTKGKPARLFHKAHLTSSGGGAISKEVANAIIDPDVRVVGVVINEVDDALGGGSQADQTWSINAIAPLQACLNAAQQIQRTVVVTADHGHVVDYEVRHATSAKGGERYRPGSETPREGEIRVTGARVLTPDHAAVVPWTETLRYSTTRSAGYHGGITPQEMLTPLAVLIPSGMTKAGWRIVQQARPGWW